MPKVFLCCWIFLVAQLCFSQYVEEELSDHGMEIGPSLVVSVGEEVILPCNFSFSGSDIALILWYRGHSGVPIYTVDMRNSTSFAESKHILSQDLLDKAFFDALLNPPGLRFKSIGIEDEDEYRCRIDYRKSRTQNFIFNLTVIVPPVRVTIKNSITQEPLNGVIGPLNQDEDLYLTCEVEGGRPLPSVVWWRDERILEAKYHLADATTTRNQIIVTSLGRKDLMAHFVCRASNSDVLPPTESSVLLDLNLKPVEVSITHPGKGNSTFLEGTKVDLYCQSWGSRPAAKLSWWISGEELTGAEEWVSNNFTYSKLSYIPRKDHNGKFMSCRAENGAMKNCSLEETIMLNVHYAPQVQISLGAQIDENSIKEGTDVYFECSINANPWITEVFWIFEGSTLYSNPSSGIIISNQSLVLQKVQRENRGRYWCAAENSRGRGRSSAYNLRILFAPVCKQREESVYGVARNELIHINCQLDGDPDDITFKWLLNNSVEIIEIRSFVTNGSQSVASYVPKSRYGYGNILCLGENMVGQQKDACVFTVVPASPPKALHNCTVRSQSFNSLHVACEAGDNGGLRQIFFLEAYNANMEKLQLNITSMDVPVFLIRNLPSATRFTLNIYAANAKGRGPSISLSSWTLSPSEEPPASGRSSQELIASPVIGILIGIISSSSLLLFIAILSLRLKSRRNPRKDGRAKALDSPSEKSFSDFGGGGGGGGGVGIGEEVFGNKLDLNVGSSKRTDTRVYLKSSMNPIYHQETYGGDSCGNVNYRTMMAPDVTYAELSLLPCKAMTEFNAFRQNCGKEESIPGSQYASIDFQSNKGIYEGNGCDHFARRESPIADGCSDLELPIETPLMERLQLDYRSHDIIVRSKANKSITRLSPNDLTTATPV